MKRSLITGTGRYVPERVVTNDDISKLIDTSPDWIKKRTGIEQRYWVPEGGGVGVSDLGLEAAKKAIVDAKWKNEDIDLIIFATLSPDIFFPGPGCLLQHKLGLKEIPALDIRQQCTGFLYGLTTADAYIRSGIANRVLLVSAEVQSTGIDLSRKGRDVAVIFGDGAAAVCIEAIDTNEKIGVINSVLYADGSLANCLMTEAPSSMCNPRLDEEMLRSGRHYPYMDGRVVFKNALDRLPKVAIEVLDKSNLKIEDIDLFIPHQANLRINQSFTKSMGINEKKVFNNIDKYGNTTAASIPIALDDAIESGKLAKNDTVMFIGLGAGITWGAIIHKFRF